MIEWCLGCIRVDKNGKLEQIARFPMYGGIRLKVEVKQLQQYVKKGDFGIYVAIAFNDSHVKKNSTVSGRWVHYLSSYYYVSEEMFPKHCVQEGVLYLRLQEGFDSSACTSRCMYLCSLYKVKNKRNLKYAYRRTEFFDKLYNIYYQKPDFDYIVLDRPIEQLSDVPYFGLDWGYEIGKFPISQEKSEKLIMSWI